MSNSISNELTITPFNGGIKLVTPSLVNKFNLMGIKEFADLPFMTYLYNRLDESVVKISEECANVCGFDSSLSATGKSIFHYTDSISTQKVLSNIVCLKQFLQQMQYFQFLRKNSASSDQ